METVISWTQFVSSCLYAAQTYSHFRRPQFSTSPSRPEDRLPSRAVMEPVWRTTLAQRPSREAPFRISLDLIPDRESNIDRLVCSYQTYVRTCLPRKYRYT